MTEEQLLNIQQRIAIDSPNGYSIKNSEVHDIIKSLQGEIDRMVSNNIEYIKNGYKIADGIEKVEIDNKNLRGSITRIGILSMDAYSLMTEVDNLDETNLECEYVKEILEICRGY